VKEFKSENESTVRQRRPPPSSGRPKVLRCVYSPDASVIGRRIELDGRRIVVGRGADCTIQIMDREVSRRHLVLAPDTDGAYVVEDLDTPNGTFQDGALCHRAPLTGQVLSFGRTFLVRDDEPTLDELPRSPLIGRAEVPTLVGSSRATEALRQSILTVARADGRILLHGPTGVGKEVAARAIHAASGRTGPFIPINCAAIPDELAEAEFFGYQRGAFTGAERDGVGYFERAEGGTLFLDEVGDLPPRLQPKLLRVLEDRIVQRLGSAQPRQVDVRIVAATHVHLPSSFFRKDLLARLGDWVLRLPPLAQRRADVLPLWCHFHGARRPMHPDFLEALLLHDWPTNVRGLMQTARRLRELVPSQDTLRFEVLPEEIRQDVAQKKKKEKKMSPSRPPENKPNGTTGAPTADQLRALLKATNGNVKRTADENGWHRNQVYRDMKKYGIDPDDYRLRPGIADLDTDFIDYDET